MDIFENQLHLFGAAMQFFDERSGRSTFGRLPPKGRKKAERNWMGYYITKMN